MGNLQEFQNLLDHYEPDLSQYSKLNEQHDYTVWRNANSKYEIEQYVKYLTTPERVKQEAQAFLLRLNQAHIVRSVFFKDNSVQELCSKSYSVTLYLEHIYLRLNDVTDVPYPDVLHLYYACFSGFLTLFKIFGYFDITEEMIGINGEFQVKVWCHSNRSIRHPVKPNTQIQRTERDMVNRIVTLIEGNTDSLSKIQSFGKYTKYKTRSTFKEALRLLSEFAESVELEIPNSMEQAGKILRSKAKGSLKKSQSKKSQIVTKKLACNKKQPNNQQRNEQARPTAPVNHKFLETQSADQINYTSRVPINDLVRDNSNSKAFKSASPPISAAHNSPKIFQQKQQPTQRFFKTSHTRTYSSNIILPNEVTFTYITKPPKPQESLGNYNQEITIPKLQLCQNRSSMPDEFSYSPKPYKENEKSTTVKFEDRYHQLGESDKSYEKSEEMFKGIKTHKHTRSQNILHPPIDKYQQKFTNPEYEMRQMVYNDKPTKLRKVYLTKYSQKEVTKQMVAGWRSNLEPPKNHD